MITVRDYAKQREWSVIPRFYNKSIEEQLVAADIFESEHYFKVLRTVTEGDMPEVEMEWVTGIYKDYDWYVKE